jgi:autotransporter passenger strand-loop-strand repeat protein
MAVVESAGAIASDTQIINGGIFGVVSGGTDVGATVGDGGSAGVAAGGTDSGSTVTSGGTFAVLSGGTASGLTINDPNDPNVAALAIVLSGGTVDGTTNVNGGELVLERGSIFETGARLLLNDGAGLLLEAPNFKGLIKDFSGSDYFDFADIKFIGHGANMTTVSWNQTGANNGTLTVANGSQAANVHLIGQYTTANFAIGGSDGAHGTFVVAV